MKTRHVYSARDLAQAREGVAAARAAGIGDECVSLLARSDIELESVPDQRKETSMDFVPAALRGAAGGGAAGLVAGLVAMAVPPIGLTLVGAGVMALAGAAMGTWSGALVGSSIPDSVRRTFEDEIEAGRVLLVIDGEDDALARAGTTVTAAGLVHLPYDTATSVS